MTAVSIVARRSVTAGGPTDTIYFCANVYSRGSPDLQPLVQARRAAPAWSPSDSLAFLAFHPPDSSHIHLDCSTSTGLLFCGFGGACARVGAALTPTPGRKDTEECQRRPSEKRSTSAAGTVVDCKPVLGWYLVSVVGMCTFLLLTYSHEFLRVTLRLSRPLVQLRRDGRANIKHPGCQTRQGETSDTC